MIHSYYDLLRKIVQILLGHIYSISPSIHFIMKEEKDNRLSFLDVLMKHFKLLHNVKKGICRCLQHWAKAISQYSDVYIEKMKILEPISIAATTERA